MPVAVRAGVLVFAYAELDATGVRVPGREDSGEEAIWESPS